MTSLDLERWALAQFEQYHAKYQSTARLPRHYWYWVDNRTGDDNFWTHVRDWVSRQETGCYNLSQLESNVQDRVVNFIYQTIRNKWQAEDDNKTKQRRRAIREKELAEAQGILPLD